MTIYLVRHAKAGVRSSWTGPDDLRPLSKAGRRQAEALADRLEKEGVTRIVSSPAVRCRQTVQPLAEHTRLPVALDDRLAEGARLEDALKVIDGVRDQHAVLCTHGDVLPQILEHLAREGVPLDGDRAEKGSVWVLEVIDDVILSARHEPAPTAPGS